MRREEEEKKRRGEEEKRRRREKEKRRNDSVHSQDYIVALCKDALQVCDQCLMFYYILYIMLHQWSCGK